MISIVNAFFLTFAALFPVVNPLGSAPIFLTMTADCSEQERAHLARGVAINGFWLLLGSLLLGSKILEFFGITIPVVRVAGGLLVTAMGWNLLSQGNNPAEREAVQNEAGPVKSRDSFYPLTLPLTVGPGSISVAVTIGSHHGTNETTQQMLTLFGAALAGVIAIAVTIYVCYRFATPVAGFLGQVGINVLVRLSAFILTCIGIQIAWSGISELIGTLGR